MLNLDEARKLAEKIILDNYAPPSVLINEKYDISYFIGRTDRYLSPPPGQPTFNILKMTRGDLAGQLNIMLLQAAREKKIIVQEGLTLKDKDEFRSISLIVRPLVEEQFPECLMLVLFDDKTSLQKGPVDIEGGAQNEELRQELQSTKERLQSVLSQLETAKHELNSAHEESKSLEEALQNVQEKHHTTYEELIKAKADIKQKEKELTTGREELKSFHNDQKLTFEESLSVIEDLQKKVDELQKVEENSHAAQEELEQAKAQLSKKEESLAYAQEELQHSGEALSLSTNDIMNLLASYENPTLILDANLCIRYFTPNITKLFTISETDKGKSIGKIKSTLIYDNFLDDAQKGLNTLAWKRIKVQDTVGNWYSVRITPYYSGDQPDGIIITFTDISILRQTREALREARNRSKSYLDVANCMILILDTEQKILEINKKGCQILGYMEEEIINKNWYDTFVPQRIRDSAKGIFKKLVSGSIESHEQYENLILTKDGEERIIVWNNALFKDENGKVSGILSAGIDVTDYKRVEAELETVHKQTDKSFAHVSQEIKTPLMAMMEGAERLKNIPPEAMKSNYMNMIGKNINDLVEFINNVANFSKLAADQIAFEIKDFDLKHLIQDLFEEIHSQFIDDSVELFCHFPENMPSTYQGDPERIRQILFILLHNAAKYTKKGEITVRVCFDESHDKSDAGAENSQKLLRISVVDNGIGIPEGAQEIIFQGLSPTSVPGAKARVGLGLPIAKCLVEMMGGRIWLHSEEGKGSEFIFTLRLGHISPIIEQEISPRQIEKVKGHRVVIVDNNPSSRDTIESYCFELGLKVLYCASYAEEVVDWLHSVNEMPDVILCDIMMPDMDGCEVAKILTEDEKFKGIKLIGTSSYPIPGAEKIAQALKFDAYLPMPIVKEDLIRIFQATLSNKKGRKKGIIT
ncbi:MAG: ATP-binding protein [bacterium]